MRTFVIITCLCANSLAAQFLDVTCNLAVEHLKARQRQDVQGLSNAVVQFFKSSSWAEDIADLDMDVDIQMAFLPSVIIGNENYFQAQILITNRQDQLYFIKDAKFRYQQGRAVTLSPAYEPLASLLEFYAYLLIAGELDTYEPMGGSAYYSKASTLAQLSQNAPHLGRSWNRRVTEVEDMSTNQDLRLAKAYFYQAFDVLAAENIDGVAFKAAMTQFYEAVNRVVIRSGIERQTTLFLSGHSDEIAEMLARAGMWDELAGMISSNPDNERIYTEYLKDRP